MAEQGDWISVLQGILQQMAATDVTELELRRGELKLKLRRAPRPAAAAPSPTPAAAPEPPPNDKEKLHRIVAPLTGIFYSAPNPSSKPYVAAGDWLEQETVVGLIETMKVFNEVVADCRGRVATVLVQQGQLVHAGDPLLLVDLSATPEHTGEVRA